MAQGPALIQEVISREVGLFTGADPDYKQTVSREVALFVGADPEAKQVVSREVSLVLSDAAPPPAISSVLLTLSARRDTATLDWSSYNQWAVRDVASYAVYYSNLGFTSTVGLTPARVVPGETFTTIFTGLPEYADIFFAVVPLDAAGNALTAVTAVSNYALTKEIISREVALFNGHEGTPQFKELISREVSLLLSNPAPPPPVTNLTYTASPTGRDISLSWEGYNQWAVRDVSAYQIFRSAAPFTSVSGLTPYATVNGETFTRTFTGEPENVDSFWAVVAVDGQGNREVAVAYKGIYILSPEVISREVALFNGHEPVTPWLRETISREVSLVMGSPEVPAPVTGIGSGFQVGTSLTEYHGIDLDWNAYNEPAQRDVRRYRIYVGEAFFDDVTGMTPRDYVADGSQRFTLTTGIEPEQIYFVAVVAEDVNGGFNPVVYAESVKSSVETLGEVYNVETAATSTTITTMWDLGGVGTDLQGFVDHFNVYFDGASSPVAVDRLLRAWTTAPGTPLTAGTAYSIRITTVDLLGTESPGVTVLATTPGLPVVAGNVDLTWNPEVVAGFPVNATLMQDATRMLAVGNFTNIGGVSRIRLARFDLSGALDAAYNPNADVEVRSAVLQADGKLLVAGSFTTIAGAARTYVARLNANGTVDTAFNPVVNGVVRAVALQTDGKIVIGGSFTQVNGVVRNRVARLEANGVLDAGFNPDVNDYPRTFAIQPDGKILMGGIFTAVGGLPRNRIARLNPDGTPDAFNPNANEAVSVITLQPDGSILAAGNFTVIGGLTRNRLALVSPAGVINAAWNPNVNGEVWSLLPQTDGRLLLSGEFTTVGGVPRNLVARLLAHGAIDPNFNPDVSGNTVNSLMLQPDGKIILGGTFGSVGGQPRNRLARLYNQPTTGTLSVVHAGQLSWLRGGASAEATETLFDVSVNNGTSWQALGKGSRITGGWELTGTVLPPAGILRGRARVASGLYAVSSGFIESRSPYNAMASADSWRQFYFENSANTGIAADAADPDGDGLVNLVERAFAQNPKDGGSRTVPSWQWTATNGSSTFEEPSGITGITYKAEWSETLEAGDWHPIPDTGIGARHTFSLPLNGAPRVFVRFRLQAVP